MASRCRADSPCSPRTGTRAQASLPLLRVTRLAGNVPVAVFPSDHYVDDDTVSSWYVRRALEVVQDRPTLVGLIGIEPSSAETDYGWIEPTPVALPTARRVPVRRSVEQPPASRVGELIARGCLWNGFVMVGSVETWLGLIRAPRRASTTRSTRCPACSTCRRGPGARRAYASLPAISFARRVLRVPAAAWSR